MEVALLVRAFLTLKFPATALATFSKGSFSRCLGLEPLYELSPQCSLHQVPYFHLGLSGISSAFSRLVCTSVIHHGRKFTIVYPIMKANDGVFPSHSHSNPFRIFLSFLIPPYLPIQQHQKSHQEICSSSGFP